MKLERYMAFFEMQKTDAYLKRTSTPYNGGADSLSRFMEYSDDDYPEGWKLKEMQRVDFNGRKIGAPMPMKTFLNNYNISINTVKTSIIAALGELARLPWIDNIKTQYGKLYATAYLGKFGLEFNGEIYSPTFELPQEGNKSGDSFWLLASSKKDKPTNELEARSVMIIDSESTNDEIEKIALNAIYQPILKKWFKEMGSLLTDPENFYNQRKKKPIMNPAHFKSAFQLIRDTGKKNFYIIFKAGHSEKSIVNSAKRGVRGYGDLEEVKVFRGKPLPNEADKKKRTAGKYLMLDRNLVFQYYNIDPNEKNMDINKYTPLTILGLEKVTNDIRYLNVKNQLTQKSFILKLKAGDIIKVPRKSTKEGNLIFNKAEVAHTAPNDNNRVAVRWLD